MSAINLRKRSHVTYYEPPEPSIDDYIFCDYCSDYVYEYCTLHGPLLDLPDDRVTAKKLSCSPEDIHRANLTLPHVFLYIAPSSIPGAGLGVFAKLTLPKDIRFGPYKGTVEDKTNISLYSWQLYKNGKATNTIDGKDVDKSNWMRYVNCARIWFEQNLLAYQYRGQIYYRTIRIVPRDTELLVFYGSEYANLLGINLTLYNLTKTIGTQEKLYEMVQKYNNGTNKDSKKKRIHEDQNKIDTPTESLPHDINNNQVNINDSQQIDNRTKPQKIDVKEINVPKKRKNRNKENFNEVTYICDYCNKWFNCKTILVSHLNVHKDKIINFKNNKKAIIDNERLKQHTRNSRLKKHIITHTGDKPYQCNLCSYKCTRSSNLKTHLLTHTGEKPYQCNLCSYKCTRSDSLKIHLLTHTGEKPYQCNLCSYKCTRSDSLKRHLLTHTGEKPYQCNLCSYKCTHSGSLKIHLLTHTGEKPYQCTLCSYKFTQSNDLKRHLLTHTGEKPYQCNLCSYKCKQSGSLKRHLLTHTGEKPYQCNLCSYKCTHSGSLKIHLLTHTGEKPYQCTLCSYKCTRSGSLKIHLLTHTGEKPYQCNLCSYKCTHSGSLKIHLLTHTGEKPYQCTLCSYKCTRSGNLKKHVLTHTGENLLPRPQS